MMPREELLLETLPDDIWYLILQKLSFPDQLKLEQLSKSIKNKIDSNPYINLLWKPLLREKIFNDGDINSILSDKYNAKTTAKVLFRFKERLEMGNYRNYKKKIFSENQTEQDLQDFRIFSVCGMKAQNFIHLNHIDFHCILLLLLKNEYIDEFLKFFSILDDYVKQGGKGFCVDVRNLFSTPFRVLDDIKKAKETNNDNIAEILRIIPSPASRDSDELLFVLATIFRYAIKELGNQRIDDEMITRMKNIQSIIDARFKNPVNTRNFKIGLSAIFVFATLLCVTIDRVTQYGSGGSLTEFDFAPNILFGEGIPAVIGAILLGIYASIKCGEWVDKNREFPKLTSQTIHPFFSRNVNRDRQSDIENQNENQPLVSRRIRQYKS